MLVIWLFLESDPRRRSRPHPAAAMRTAAEVGDRAGQAAGAARLRRARATAVVPPQTTSETATQPVVCPPW